MDPKDKEEALVNSFTATIRTIMRHGSEGWVGTITLPDGEQWRISVDNLTQAEHNRFVTSQETIIRA